MFKFDVLNLNRAPLSGYDPLETLISYPGEEGLGPVDAGSATTADGWGSPLGDQGFTELLFGADGFGGAVVSGSTGEFASAPAYAAYAAWMDGLGDYGDRVAALQEDSGGNEIAADSSLAQGAPEVMIIDGGAFAKGENNGKGKGPQSDDGSTDSGVLKSYTSGAEGAYNIDINFKGGDWSENLQQEFLQAADLLSSIIYGDIQDVFFRGKIIDDIVINAELVAIDGEGGILGRAGPTAIRTDGFLPATAIMEFDIADAMVLDSTDVGLWGEVVFHEMMHSIGFGTVWSYLGLVDNSDPDAPLFNGAYAQFANDGVVRLEESGGSGTALSHWDDAIFTSEILTGYIYTNTGTSDDPNWVAADIDVDMENGFVSLTDDASVSDLSNMTIASLEDLGYETIWPDDDMLFA